MDMLKDAVCNELRQALNALQGFYLNPASIRSFKEIEQLRRKVHSLCDSLDILERRGF